MSRRRKLDRSKLPSTIHIGINTYTLVHWDPEEAEKEGLYGYCDKFTFVIKVRTDVPDSGFAETLEHEINHACWEAAKLKSKAAEETVVNRLTPILMQARRDNPEIYDWIDKAIAQKE
ncbi:hypothetical protein I6F34_01090 [Bradyrhizobium sp. BRP05]|nr:hypothetical protein [Bradyrhizobium sp. BRP05]